jgi:hypothetical protein
MSKSFYTKTNGASIKLHEKFLPFISFYQFWIHHSFPVMGIASGFLAKV